MVRRTGIAEVGFREQMIDALVFSLAVYEEGPEKILSVLKYKYDLPVGALDLLHLEGHVSQGILASARVGQRPCQPVIVGRSTHGHVVVACRGTADLSDLIQDLKIIPKWVRGGRGGAAAHMGFVERAESVDLEPFLRLLARGEKVVFTGHSLGGAVSALLALRVLEAAESHNICTHLGQVQCITFGSPLFASPELANCINEKWYDRFCHVVSKRDLVPRIVPLVRMAQRLAGCWSNEVFDGMRIVRWGLQVAENVTKIPFATAVRLAEAFLPGPVKGLLGSAIGLMCFRRTPQQYAFAGQFLFIDPMAQDHMQEGAVHIAKGEDLNAFQSELAFALGLNVNIMENHGLSAYQQGLVKGLRSRLLAHFHKRKAHGIEQVDAGDLVEDESRWGPFSKPRRSRTSKQRHSMEFSRLRPGGGVAAAAMEAASAGYRTAKLAKLRRSVERGFGLHGGSHGDLWQQPAMCLDSVGERGRNGAAGAEPGAPEGQFRKASGLRRWDGRSWELAGERALCCTLCRLKKQAQEKGRAGQPPVSSTDGKSLQAKHPGVAAEGGEPKGRLRLGWFLRGAVTLAKLVRSWNVFTIASCAVRYFLGCPLF